jgi:hypothetical protein
MTSMGALSTPASRSEMERAADGVRPKALKTDTGAKLTVLDDIRRGVLEQRCWTANERLVIALIRLLTDNGTLCTPRISVRQISDKLRGEPGRGPSKRTIQRILRILKLAGVITIHGAKVAGTQINDRSIYEFHPKVLLEWSGAARPPEWDAAAAPEDHAGEDEACLSLPPSLADAVEAARLLGGRPTHDPVFTRAAKDSLQVDTRRRNQARARARMAARDARIARSAADVIARVTAAVPEASSLPAFSPAAPDAAPPSTAEGVVTRPEGGDSVTPPPSPQEPTFSGISPGPAPSGGGDTAGGSDSVSPPHHLAPPVVLALERPPGGAVEVEVELVDQAGEDDELVVLEEPPLTPQEIRAFDGEILSILCRYPCFRPIATRPAAAKVGWSARKRGTPLERCEVALERFAFKLGRGLLPTATTPLDLLRLARAFVKRDRGVDPDAPVPDILAQIPRPPTEADVPDPTAEEIAEMNAHLGLTLESRAELRARVERWSLFDRAAQVLRARAPQQFDMWLRGAQYESLAEDGALVLRVQNDFILDWVKANFQTAIVVALAELLGVPVRVTWVVNPRIDTPVPLGVCPTRLDPPHSS